MESQEHKCARWIVSFRYLRVIALILLACRYAPFASAQDICGTVFDVGDKVTATPHHLYVTSTAPPNGGTRTSEAIFVDGAIYSQTGGKWRKSATTVQQTQKQEQENRKNVKNASCRHVRDEIPNGEPAGVFSAHLETDYTKSDSLIWISKNKGLVLRQEDDLDIGGDKSHVSVRYEYSNVSAPNVSP
jgi:hypothetical protein